MSRPSSGLAMARKRERHYNETKTVIAYALMIFGACSCVSLVMMWPQVFIISIFNSKMAFNLVLDAEDYFTCNSEYIDFVIDEPDPSASMFQVFVFNVTNSDNVINRGFKPTVTETGPYGFVRSTYRYEISFNDPQESTDISFKEYSILTEVADPDECERMYYRMERDALEANPCAGSTCKCRDPDELVTVVNPLMLRTLWEDTPAELMAHYSVDVFSKLKTLLEDPFTEAVKAHLVGDAFKEVYLFRSQMQIGQVMVAAVESLQAKGYTLHDISTQVISEATCNLAQFDITSCPFTPYTYVQSAKSTGGSTLPAEDYPSILPLLNISDPRSALDLEYGLPRLLGLAWYLDEIVFNSAAGYTMVTELELDALYTEYVEWLLEYSFGAVTYTSNQRIAASRLVKSFCFFMAQRFLTPFQSRFSALALVEFRTDYSQVACSPLGLKCVWQWGYLVHYEGTSSIVDNALAFQLLDVTTEIGTNPTSLYKDLFAPKWYNAHSYCRDVYRADANFNINCTNLAYTVEDALITQPAGLWGKDTGESTFDFTLLNLKFTQQSESVREYYFHMSCNISYLIQQVYRESTVFHDNYVVYYLNKHRDPLFTHNFTVGAWNELGLAQWGGGFITYALAKVRSTHLLVRDGMWRIGQENYYEDMVEYSSWAVVQGYPHAWIYSVNESRTLLHALAARNEEGKELRRHVTLASTTFVGDGVNFVNALGAVGESTFTIEAARGDFSCSGASEAPCALLNRRYSSSSAECVVVQDLFNECVNQYTFQNEKWIDLTQCTAFETSATSPTFGVQCDNVGIFGEAHPYTKSVGNIVYQMLYSMTLALELQEGLWCAGAKDCSFSWGGMFATTTVRKLLFEGYTEPSLLKYLNLKHHEDDIKIECAEDPYDTCGVQQYRCFTPGVALVLPNGDKKLLRYGNTSNEEYFAPYFVVTNASEMLWPFAISNDTSAYAAQKMATTPYTTVRNPHWAVYPALTARNDSDFNKHYQCQKRVLFGEPGLYNSCVDTLHTGRKDTNNTLDLKIFHGNSTVYPFSKGVEVGGSTVNNQNTMYRWEGFQTYPYGYLGRAAGLKFNTKKQLSLFEKPSALSLNLYQDSLLFEFQRLLTLTLPLTEGPGSSFPAQASLPARRFVEDVQTWNPYRNLGTPNDSYGMPFTIPVGFASMERFAKFPIYVETPHSYGNEVWGGLEYTFVTGTVRRA
ncbi:hypothetical protein B484DRAFT_454671, partial [Ochromonadaceae sp. CCMP2298]